VTAPNCSSICMLSDIHSNQFIQRTVVANTSEIKANRNSSHRFLGYGIPIFKLDHIFEDCQRQQFHKMSHGERKGRLNVVKFLELVKDFFFM